jgi:hypothetical protein
MISDQDMTILYLGLPGVIGIIITLTILSFVDKKDY